MKLKTRLPLAELQREEGVFTPKPYFSKRLQYFQQEMWYYFQKHGFPSSKHEEWRYFSLRDFVKSPISWGIPPSFILEELPSSLVELVPEEGDLLVFYNGFFQSHLSRLSAFQVTPFEEVDSALLEVHFGSYVNTIQAPMVALNTALFHKGYLIQTVDQGTLFLFHIYDVEPSLLIQPRYLWLIHHPCILFEMPVSLSSNPLGVNAVSEYVIDKGADVHHEYWVMQESPLWCLNTAHFHLNGGVEFKQIGVTTGRYRSRSRLEVCLHGEKAKAHLFGLYFGTQGRWIANTTFVDHAVLGCESNELYKGIARDQAQCAFNGQILVRPEAQLTNAFQENRNLLLSDEATINTKPQLEIFADDVKCSHGATVGQLEEDMIFYLRTRGIPLAQAEKLLLQAFIDEILSKSKSEKLKKRFLLEVGLNENHDNETA